FVDNPRHKNLTTVKRLVEEACQSSPMLIINKKRKANKLVFPGATVKDSEVLLLEEDPNTPSNQKEVSSEVKMIPQKG
ncbi:hypothetical protein O181_088425, partial [Austropuccinia psidii MF-1]|nr:hypothetical protein [Austropuccinia psidii MF-1]